MTRVCQDRFHHGLLDDVAVHPTSVQIDEAQRRAREWKPASEP